MSTDYLNNLIRVVSDVQYQAEYVPQQEASRPPLICGPISLTPVPYPMGEVELPAVIKACAPTFFEVPAIPPPISLPENCPDGITFNSSNIGIYDGIGVDPVTTITVGATQSSDFCSYDLVLPPALVIPCYPDGIVFTDTIKFAGYDFTQEASIGDPLAIDQPIQSTIDLQHTTEDDPPGLRSPAGCSWDGTTVQLPFPVCEAGFHVESNITVKRNDLAPSTQVTSYSTPNQVNAIKVTDGGSGYVSTPTVTISTGGSGAAASATLSSEALASVAVDTQGSGYIAGTNVIVVGDGHGATVSPTITAGAITAISVINGGSGYTTAQILISSNTALAKATISGGGVTGITVINGGNGFNSAPSVSISAPGSGTTAIATCTVTNGVITKFNITGAGSGYTTPPYVYIAAPAPTSSATATATIASGAVTGITVSAHGSGYATRPGVIISGGGGAGAKAIVVDGYNSIGLNKDTTDIEGQTRCDFALDGEINLGLNNVLFCDSGGLNPPNVNPVEVTQNDGGAEANLQLASTVNDQGFCSIGITGTINIPPTSSLGGVVYINSNFTVDSTHNGKLITHYSGANHTLTLPLDPSQIKLLLIQNNGPGILCISGNTGNGIDNSTDQICLDEGCGLALASTGEAGTGTDQGYYTAVRACEEKMHPFKIYQKADTTPTADDWRKFRVHHGLVFLDWVQISVTGLDSDTSTSTLADDATDKFWFWLQIDSGAGTIQSSSTEPVWDSSHIPIGYVDTTSNPAVVTQIVTTNLFLCS